MAFCVQGVEAVCKPEASYYTDKQAVIETLAFAEVQETGRSCLSSDCYQRYGWQIDLHEGFA